MMILMLLFKNWKRIGMFSFQYLFIFNIICYLLAAILPVLIYSFIAIFSKSINTITLLCRVNCLNKFKKKLFKIRHKLLIWSPLIFILLAGFSGLFASFQPVSKHSDHNNKFLIFSTPSAKDYVLANEASSYKEKDEFRVPIELKYWIDGISRLFGALISFFAIITAIFSFSYLSPEGIGKTKQIKMHQLTYIPVVFSLFLLAMTQIVYADNMILFIYCWEVMTLSSAAFAYFKHLSSTEKKVFSSTSRITLTSYLISGQVSTVLLLSGLMLTSPDTYTLSELFGKQKTLSFVLLFCGFGIKAAMVPFHFWLPFINYSSPGNAHALHSSIMVKVGIYGIVRLLFSSHNGVAPWMAELTIIFGALTVLVGIQYAIVQHDLKKALAYHTVENIGIILIGLGVAALTMHYKLTAVSVIALIAALFHVINHAFFKGLLLLIVGQIEMLKNKVHIDQLKGLFKIMPIASIFFMIGAMSISAIPPLNGFASEWMTFQSLIAGIQQLNDQVPKIILLIGFVFLAYGCAGTALCFTKICGLILFRGNSEKKSEETVKGTTKMFYGIFFSTAILAFCCVLSGLFPGGFIQLICISMKNSSFLEPMLPFLDKILEINSWTGILHPDINFTIFPIDILLFLSVMIVSVISILYFMKRKHKPVVKNVSVWNCGSDFEINRMSANADQLSMFYLENTFFSRLKAGKKENPFLESTLLETPNKSIQEYFLNVYEYVLNIIQYCSSKIGNCIQNGDVRTYIAYILISLILLCGIFGVRYGIQ